MNFNFNKMIVPVKNRNKQNLLFFVFETSSFMEMTIMRVKNRNKQNLFFVPETSSFTKITTRAKTLVGLPVVC